MSRRGIEKMLRASSRPVVDNAHRARVDREFREKERRAKEGARKAAITRRENRGLRPPKAPPPPTERHQPAPSERWCKPPVLRSGVFLLLHEGAVVYVGSGSSMEEKIPRCAALKAYDAFLYLQLARHQVKRTRDALVRVLRPVYNKNIRAATPEDLELTRELLSS